MPNNKVLNNIKVSNFWQLKTLLSEFNNKAQSNALFTSSLWLETWHDVFWQENWQLHSYACYKNKELIALAPFYVKKEKSFPFIKTLHLVGQGEPEKSGVASEYGDILIKTGYEQEVYPQLISLLSDLKFDTMAARAIFSDSHIAKVMTALTGKHLTRNFARYYLPTDNFTLQKISKNTRSRIKRSINQFSKINAETRWLTIDEINTFWPKLVEFHQCRWSRKGAHGAFLSTEFNQFHQTLIKKHNHSIASSAIFVNDEPIAINYYLVDKNTYYFYQSGWDESLYAKFSPGLYLHYWSIMNCPVIHYDFMMGGLNNSYKAKFGCKNTPMLSLILTNNYTKDFLNKAINKIKEWLFN
jgi:hypothetical protein